MSNYNLKLMPPSNNNSYSSEAVANMITSITLTLSQKEIGNNAKEATEIAMSIGSSGNSQGFTQFDYAQKTGTGVGIKGDYNNYDLTGYNKSGNNNNLANRITYAETGAAYDYAIANNLLNLKNEDGSIISEDTFRQQLYYSLIMNTKQLKNDFHSDNQSYDETITTGKSLIHVTVYRLNTVNSSGKAVITTDNNMATIYQSFSTSSTGLGYMNSRDVFSYDDIASKIDLYIKILQTNNNSLFSDENIQNSNPDTIQAVGALGAIINQFGSIPTAKLKTIFDVNNIGDLHNDIKKIYNGSNYIDIAFDKSNHAYNDNLNGKTFSEIASENKQIIDNNPNSPTLLKSVIANVEGNIIGKTVTPITNGSDQVNNPFPNNNSPSNSSSGNTGNNSGDNNSSNWYPHMINLNIENVNYLSYIGDIQRDPLILTKNNFSINSINSYDNSYMFNSNGIEYKTAWIQSNEWFLVYFDADGNVQQFNNSFSNLKQYDTNNDGVIDSSDDGYNYLYLWNGEDSNDIQRSDLQSLSEFGIKSISLNSVSENTNINGSTLTGTSIVTMNDGSQYKLGSFNLSQSLTYTITVKDQDLSSGAITPEITLINTDGTTSTIDLTTLPNLHGYGVLSSLTASMITIGTDGAETLNNSLYQDTLSLSQINLSTASYSVILQDFDNLLHDWELTGTVYEGNTGIALPDETINPNYYLQFVDKYLGQAAYFNGHNTYTNYGYPSSVYLNDAYNTIERTLESAFFLQSQLSNLEPYISYNEDDDMFFDITSYADLIKYANQNYDMSYGTSYYNIISNIIVTTTISEAETFQNTLNDMSSVNAEEASEMLMTGQGISLTVTNNTLSVETKLDGNSTYIWSGVINETLYNQVSNRSMISEYVIPKNSNILLNNNMADDTISYNNGYLTFSNGQYNFNIQDDVFKQVTNIIFKDETISENNGEFVINNDALVLSDTSILKNNMYILQTSTISYNFSQSITIDGSKDYTINLNGISNLFTIDNFVSSSNGYTLSYNGYILDIVNSQNKITLEQNEIVIGDIVNGVMETNVSSKTSSSISSNITSSGTYTDNSTTSNNIINIQNTSGTDTIYLTGYNTGTYDTINFITNSTDNMKIYQINANDIEITYGALTIDLKNAMSSIYFSTPYNYDPTYIYTPIKSINGNSNNLYYNLNIQQFNGIAITGYSGTFVDTLNADTTDLIIRTGTNNNITNSDGHSFYIESENGKITTGQSNIYINANITKGVNVYTYFNNIFNNAEYSNGNIILTNTYDGNIYEIMNAIDFSEHMNIIFKNGTSQYSSSINNLTINYNINNETFAANQISENEILNVTGQQDIMNFTNIFNNEIVNINGNGNYIINDSYINGNLKINENSLSNLDIENAKNATIYLNFNASDANFTIDNGNLLIAYSGYNTTIENYSSFSGYLYFNNQMLSTSSINSISVNETITNETYIKNENLYTSGNNISIIYKDNYAKTSIYDQTKNSNEIFNVNNDTDLKYVGQSSNLTFNLLQNNYLTFDYNGTFNNVVLSDSSLSFSYTYNQSGTNSYVGNITVNNAIDYFSTNSDNQDVLKIKDTDTLQNTPWSNITATLDRNIITEASSSTILTSNNKILLSSDNLTITDSSTNNEFSINNQTQIIIAGENDKILLNQSSQNSIFGITGDYLTVENLKTGIVDSIKTSINNEIVFNNGKSISSINANLFAQDYSKMNHTLGSYVPDTVSNQDWQTLSGLFKT